MLKIYFQNGACYLDLVTSLKMTPPNIQIYSTDNDNKITTNVYAEGDNKAL